MKWIIWRHVELGRCPDQTTASARFERKAMAAARIGRKGIIDVADFDRDANGLSGQGSLLLTFR